MEQLYDAAAQRAEEMRQHLTDRAMEDADFRQQLISDPKATIAGEFGVEVPENFTIVVHQSDANTLHLTLPAGPELNEEQLEMIAAGLSCCL